MILKFSIHNRLQEKHQRAFNQSAAPFHCELHCDFHALGYRVDAIRIFYRDDLLLYRVPCCQEFDVRQSTNKNAGPIRHTAYWMV